jgi:AcrR family transcriptional regulator
MGRPAAFPRQRILDGALTLVAEDGPAAATVGALAAHLEAPVGSLYHRYASRDLLLADLWLETVEGFQPEFLTRLRAADPMAAAIDAVRFAWTWVASHPREAHVLLLHRREDFMSGPWPAPFARRAGRLDTGAGAGMRDYCRRLYGRTSAALLRRVRLALVDLPQGAARPYIQAGAAPPADLLSLVEDACAHLLRTETRRRGAPARPAVPPRR